MTEREAFEEFAKTHDMDLAVLGATLGKPIYSDCNTDYAWLAWQASRKQALEEPNVYEQALRKVLGVVQRYLPPDSPITEKAALSEIISIVDPGPWPAGPLSQPTGGKE